jgi:endoglucanase
MLLEQRTIVTVVLGTLLSCAAQGQGTGYWHTSGNQILDANNQTVRIAGVNWYGFETTDEVVHGLWAQDYRSILNAVKANGYNTVRLPFSNQMVESPIVPSNISYNNSSGAINTDLKGLNSLQIMDRIIAYAGQIGLRVILDNHRSEAGNSAEANGLWYTSAYPESAWINDWKTLASRYVGNTTVVGADLRNEPHNATGGGSCWGCGSATNDWQLAAQRGGNAVLSVNPNWLIFVEGTDCFNGSCDWWGGNLQGAQSYPVTLNTPNRLVYSAHDYGPHEYGQSWFNSSTTPASLQAVWTKNWAYLSQNGTAPVWLGEFGTTNNSSDIQNTVAGSQGQWFQTLVSFLGSNPAISWTYWALNGEDSYGLLDSNYDSVPASSQKQQLLASIQAPLSSGGGGTPSCQSAPAIPAGVTASGLSSSQINVSWNAVAAPAGCSVAYNVYESETAGFTPSSSNQVASGLTASVYSATGLAAGTTYYFVVAAVDAAGPSGNSSPVNATTQANTGGSPAPPSNLSAAAISASQINLTWTASSTSGVTYNVYRSQSSGFMPSSNTRIATGVNGTSYSSSALAAASAYYFLVTAVNANGESGASNQAAATTQSVVTGAACHVTYVINSQWDNGFNTSITIQNTGGATINSWTLTWNWSGNQTITQAWNSNLQSGGPQAVLTNASWNGSIAPGASISGIGFNASYNGSNPNPTAFYLNGTMCR